VRKQLGVLRPTDLSERTLHALEKEVEHGGDVMMQKLGFEGNSILAPGKTRQTPEIPDRRLPPAAGRTSLGPRRTHGVAEENAMSIRASRSKCHWRCIRADTGKFALREVFPVVRNGCESPAFISPLEAEPALATVDV